MARKRSGYRKVSKTPSSSRTAVFSSYQNRTFRLMRNSSIAITTSSRLKTWSQGEGQETAWENRRASYGIAIRGCALSIARSRVVPDRSQPTRKIGPRAGVRLPLALFIIIAEVECLASAALLDGDNRVTNRVTQIDRPLPRF